MPIKIYKELNPAKCNLFLRPKKPPRNKIGCPFFEYIPGSLLGKTFEKKFILLGPHPPPPPKMARGKNHILKKFKI